MTSTRLLFLTIFTSSLLVSAACAQGLIGLRYTELNGGYVRVSGFGESIDGWGAGASLNAPLTAGQEFGVDFNGGLGYLRMTESGVRLDGYGLSGVFRGYARVRDDITPYAEAGLGWSRARVRGFGSSATDSAFTLPLGVGIELLTGSFSLTPFFRYTIDLENNIGDTLALGAKAAYWFEPNWGVTLEAAYIDFDGDVDGHHIIGGLVYRF